MIRRESKTEDMIANPSLNRRFGATLDHPVGVPCHMALPVRSPFARRRVE